jgi:hypothetical protein
MLAGSAVQGFESRRRRRDGLKIQVRLGGREMRSAEDRILCFDLCRVLADAGRGMCRPTVISAMMAVGINAVRHQRSQ